MTANQNSLALTASKLIRVPWRAWGAAVGRATGRKPLRVAVSAAGLSPGVGGVGNYTMSLLRGWARWQPDSPLAIFCTKQNFSAIQALPLPARLRHFYLDHEEDIFEHQGEFDLIYYSMGTLAVVPPPRLCAFHFADLQDYFFPENFSRETLSRRRNTYRSVLACVDGLLVPSEFTRESVVSLLGVERERVHVAPLLVADLPARGSRPAGLPFERFVYYPADDYPHKNHGRLLEALRLLEDRGETVSLVCTGGRGAGTKLEEMAAANGLGGQFVHLGKVSREEVRWLYEHAVLVVFPSLFEGFGLPVIEAFSCGTPVVCSGVTSLPEVAGDAAVYCDPFDAADIAQKIETVWRDPALRADLVTRGTARFREFRTRDIVAKHRDIFELMLSRGKRVGDFSLLPVPDEHAAQELYASRTVVPIGKPRPAPEPPSISAPAGAALPPIHFFTIVLNGMPFLPRQLEVFDQLPFRWHWHVIEGVADLVHDTAWSQAKGGRISDALHANGRSVDGTTEYLDSLAAARALNVTVYRKTGFWNGKVEMVNAPLANVRENCLLWQVDADEFWTPAQILKMGEWFAAEPERSGASFYCRYFVSPRHVLDNIGSYGNNPGAEWRRVWNYQPGDRWASHEPPRLVHHLPNGETADVMDLAPILHHETQDAGLVFDHLAYCTEQQLRFKEEYYGYTGALEKWQRMVQADPPQFLAKEYLGWITDPVWAIRVEDR